MSLDMLGSAVVSSGEDFPFFPLFLLIIFVRRDDGGVAELDAGLRELPPPQPAPGHGRDVPVPRGHDVPPPPGAPPPPPPSRPPDASE